MKRRIFYDDVYFCYVYTILGKRLAQIFNIMRGLKLDIIREFIFRNCLYLPNI